MREKGVSRPETALEIEFTFGSYYRIGKASRFFRKGAFSQELNGRRASSGGSAPAWAVPLSIWYLRRVPQPVPLSSQLGAWLRSAGGGSR